jgi:F-type H+-transporting ATPase subunit delta
MNVFIKKLALALYRSSIGKSKSEIDTMAVRACELLATKRLLKKKKDFLSALEAARQTEEGIVKATIASRVPLPANEMKAIRAYLKKTERRTVETVAITDPMILGGFRIRVRDIVIDATINHQLKKLATQLT